MTQNISHSKAEAIVSEIELHQYFVDHYKHEPNTVGSYFKKYKAACLHKFKN